MLTTLMEHIAGWLGKLPMECLQFNFMQMALLATLIISPLTAAAGVQVINNRMAFFADAIGHSAFAGAALGLLLFGAAGPVWVMPLLAALIGLGVMYLKETSKLTSDTVIGVFFAFTVSGGLLLLSLQSSLQQMSQMFVFGDILTITAQDTAILLVLALLYTIFIFFSYNAMLIIAIDEPLARAHRIRSRIYNYLHIVLLAIIVIFSVKAVGVLLVGAMLIVPAAAARNLAHRAGSMFISAIFIGLIAGVSGLLISAQEWANTAAGATMVMASCVIFLLSCIYRKIRS